MKSALFLRLLLVIGFLSQSACGDNLIAPRPSETLPVTVQSRAPAPGETVPTVQLTGGAGSLTMRVTRGELCATVVTAGFTREIGGLAIVTRVRSNPDFVCIGQFQVVDYQGTIFSLPSGKYRVRLFEAVEDGKPQQLSTGIVTVAPPNIVTLDARNR
jgi:hypothetical protein